MDDRHDTDDLAREEADALFARLEACLPSNDEARSRLERQAS
jgi:hypothetical protein